MTLGTQVAAQLPYLRRYARALTGSQASGDAFVRATLEAALLDQGLQHGLSEGRVPLYRAFSRLFAQAGPAGSEAAGDPDGAAVVAAQHRLAAITPLNRQALLLTTLEAFGLDDAAAIMDLAEGQVEDLIREAIAEIERESATSVLIIEDEPLISMQLEDLVSALGHELCGTAATRSQALQVVTERRPGLVLADVQLADGSSGLDAVEDILKLGEIPVIFITAYPERLLTGNRPEPTYLITKPFQESTVRAAISQALFFHSGRPID